MLALLIPLLALFPVAHSAPTHQDFKEPIQINFNLNNETFPRFGWSDILDYPDNIDKEKLRKSFQIPVNETVGILNLRSTKDIRNISWTKKIMDVPVRVCTILLTGDPQTPFINVDLENKKVADNQSNTAKLLKIDCKEASFSTAAKTAATAISTKPRELPEHIDRDNDGWIPGLGNEGIHDGSYDSPTAKDMSLNPTSNTQVRLNWIKIKGTTDQERTYKWEGMSEDGPVSKQCCLKVIADLNVSEALIWVDSGEVKLGDEALNRQSFFHYCNTTGPDGRVTGPDGKVIQQNVSVIQQ